MPLTGKDAITNMLRRPIKPTLGLSLLRMTLVAVVGSLLLYLLRKGDCAILKLQCCWWEAEAEDGGFGQEMRPPDQQEVKCQRPTHMSPRFIPNSDTLANSLRTGARRCRGHDAGNEQRLQVDIDLVSPF